MIYIRHHHILCILALLSNFTNSVVNLAELLCNLANNCVLFPIIFAKATQTSFPASLVGFDS